MLLVPAAVCEFCSLLFCDAVKCCFSFYPLLTLIGTRCESIGRGWDLPGDSRRFRVVRLSFKKDRIRWGRKSTKVMLLNVTKRSGSSESTIILIKHQHSDIFRNDDFVWGEVLPAMKCLYFTCVTSCNFKTCPIVCRTILGEHKRDNLVV